MLITPGIIISVFDIALMSLGVALLFFVHEIALGLRKLIHNTVTGLIVFGACHLVGIGVALTPLRMFEIAVGGAPAALLTVIIGYTGILAYSFSPG